ncbi:LysR family transcriptional regulator [Chitinophaga horti]|uniref:LysR family transcriptional regulator n=1 Tax=Chitinophaga horti TaxID=2920382 RepID=A0ABY6J7Y9_9BACT|nr:LysR family transcriptional regulator [Chitinophaga horti]UYQ95805.1 LysR family transcriptional regulator [Chitinophaga horti]
MINLEWYRTFIAIYQQGNLTRAAEELVISQPNVSVHLAALEQYVGGKLFERLPRQMLPTEMGKQLYTQVVRSVENLGAVERSFQKPTRSKRPTIRLGAPLEFFDVRLSTRMKKVPSRLDVSFGVGKELLQQLSEGGLDFVIASRKATDKKHLVYEPVLTEKLVIVANKKTDLKAFRQQVRNEDYEAMEQWLLAQDWFAYSNDLALIRRFWLTNFNKRPVITPKCIIPNLSVILKSISEGKGFSVVPDFLAKDFAKQGKITIVWEGIADACDTLYLSYDKSKVSAARIEEMRALVNL